MYKNKIIYLLSFLLVISYISDIGNCYTISGSGLYFNVTGLPEKDKYLHYEIGDRKIVNYDVLSTEKIDENLYQFRSRIYLSTDLNVYTSYGAGDIFSNVQYRETSFKYITLKLCTSPLLGFTYQDPRDYYIKYNEYDLSNAKLLAKGFSGFININAGYVLPKLYVFDIEKQEFTAKTESMVVSTEKIVCSSNEFSEIGNYKDVFYTQKIENLATVNTMQSTVFGGHDIKTDILDLGIFPGEIKEYSYYENGIPYQAKNLPITVGRDDLQNKDIYFSIQPEIKIYKQDLKKVSRDYATVDIEENGWDWNYVPFLYGAKYTAPLETVSSDRIIGFAVQNYNIKQSFQIEIIVTSTVKFEVSNGYHLDLEDPALKLGDVYWENIIQGKGFSVTTSEDPFVTFFRVNSVWIILVVGGIAFLILMIKFPSFRGLVKGAIMKKRAAALKQ